jgi:signal peptidase I
VGHVAKEGKEDTGKTILVNVLLLIIGLGVAYGIYVGIEFAYSTDAPLRVVVSGSMIPKYNINDVVVVKGVGLQYVSIFVFNVPVQGVDPSSIRVNDDIIFWYQPYGLTDPIVHEVISIIPNSSKCQGDLQFITHGLNNPVGVTEYACGSSNDGNFNYIIGVVTGKIPYVGYVSEFMRSFVGLTVIIVLIGILLAIEILEPKNEEEPSTTKK